MKAETKAPGAQVRRDGMRKSSETTGPDDLTLDEKSVALFAGIHASKSFTREAAHSAFAGLKRRDRAPADSDPTGAS